MFNAPLLRRMCVSLSVCLLLLLSSFAHAQTVDTSSARKVDEFGDIQASDLIARLDNFAVELQNQPNARGFLFVYRTRRDLPGLSNRYAHRMKSYLVDSRGIASERVVTVDGGETSCLSQELWLVPAGAAPKPRTDAYSVSYRPSVYKFDEHSYSLPDEPVDDSYWAVAPADLNAYLESFAQALRKDSGAVGYLIAYGSVGRDGPGVARNMLRKEKNFLTKEYGIKPSRIKTIAGGIREWRTMELWMVRKGDYAPVINSYRLSPVRRKR